jgi:hypothetical protein
VISLLKSQIVTVSAISRIFGWEIFGVSVSEGLDTCGDGNAVTSFMFAVSIGLRDIEANSLFMLRWRKRFDAGNNKS